MVTREQEEFTCFRRTLVPPCTWPTTLYDEYNETYHDLVIMTLAKKKELKKRKKKQKLINKAVNK